MGPKKPKGVQMSLGNFLGDQSLGSWADEMEDSPLPSSGAKAGYSADRGGFGSGSFGGDRQQSYQDRGFSVREQLPLPKEPPYTAHLGNLSFDITEGDVEDFFSGCEVTSVRIVEDKLDRKPKGFGYVEFKSLEGLKQALTKNETSFQGRNIRISVADPPKDRPQTREISDWTRKGPLPDIQNQRRVSSGPPRSFDAASDAGSDRADSRRRGGPPFEGDGKVRDFGNWERRGPLSPSVAQPPPSREGPPRARPTERSFERKPSPAWGEGRDQREPRSQEGSRPPRPIPAERAPTAADMDNQWRARMKPDAPPPAPAKSPSQTPDISTPSSPAATHAQPTAPASRPRLNLAKRTVSEAPKDDAEKPTSATSGDAKASPFGAARPVDSAQRDQAIAEKREAQRVQKEADDKALAEKRAAEKAEAARAKAEQRDRDRASAPPTPTTGAQENGNASNGAGGPRERKMSRQQTGGGAAASNESKENGATAAEPARPRYEILQRMQNEDGGANDDASTTTGGAGEELEDAEGNDNANGTIADDKNIKPIEVVRDIGAGDGVGDETTADALEGDGWSTVPSKTAKGSKHRKTPSQGVARALAS